MSGSKFFLAFIVLAIGILTVWGIQYYNFYAFKSVLIDSELDKFFEHFKAVDDEKVQIIANKIIHYCGQEGYPIDIDDIEFYAIITGTPDISYEIYQITSENIDRGRFTAVIKFHRKSLMFDKIEEIRYTKELRN